MIFILQESFAFLLSSSTNNLAVAHYRTGGWATVAKLVCFRTFDFADLPPTIPNNKNGAAICFTGCRFDISMLSTFVFHNHVWHGEKGHFYAAMKFLTCICVITKLQSFDISDSIDLKEQ